ncbi:hypothetical protein KG892_02975 [Vermiphilus pyriformis]|uniref:Uncharacterized protein n=1 Tax=candidate division TM6 bacterium JCVI TM6SC1 TaxID=1306947 RepID=A0A0D2I2I5_9BACT|nr:hypothetical protein J120_00255 [candidate division TM6 bacterium JCVI TM6SC1]UNE34940.1 MAG: hypothetical protein KG892_02975 [Vermiphilus pyriformis]
MKHPFWILNNVLLILCIVIFFFIMFGTKKLPRPVELSIPTQTVAPTRQNISHIPLEKIYQDDLFGTYSVPPPPAVVARDIPALPTPPFPQGPKPIQEATLQFLEPLNVTLKGIIAFIGDDAQNRVIIADNKTNQESSYRTGDRIEDAQLLRIFTNKILLIRSNGQQEILFLREREAQKDPIYAMLGGWQEIVQKKSENEYTIAQDQFVERVNNLAQFIDLLDLTTAYYQGTIIGSRIGIVVPNSLGTALGLQTGDIVTKINGIPATGTSERFTIYKNMTNARPGTSVEVEITRGSQNIVFTYTLYQMNKSTRPAGSVRSTPRASTQEVLSERYKFAPTEQGLYLKEKEAMKEHGRLIPE